jgi:serine/threonine protein kinase
VPTQTQAPRLNSPFLNIVLKSRLLKPDELNAVLAHAKIDPATAEPAKVAALLVRKKLLTKFQAVQLLNGRTQGFILDQYRILDGIRQDRVGIVFKAEDTRARRLVALKVLPLERTGDPTVLNAFLREVRLAEQVDHPAVARVLDVGNWQGNHFVASEYVPEPTLDQVVAKAGRVDPHAAAQLIAQVAVGLMHAHDCGLVHRDLKPGSVAVLPERRVKLIDLGLTHLLESPWARVTKRISTKEYAEEIAHIAPEQAWGCEMDARSDVYSLGSTFYYALTGQVPFPGLAPETMTERQIRGVPSPTKLAPGVTKEMDAIVRRMGAKDPHVRYQSAREVVIAMQAWLPVAQWNALGLSKEQPKLVAPPTKAPATPVQPKQSPTQSKGSVFGFLGRLFGH